MFDNDYITQTELLEAMDAPLKLKRGTRYTQRREPYFFDYVQEELIERYGVGVVRRGGLKIHTTIQPGLQDAAREAINAYYGDPAGPASAIVAVDPATGKIRAMASSGTYDERRFNLAAQGHRQPGSAFKTFVLTAAILDGVDPDSTSYTSKPLNIDDPTYGHWEVKTFGNSYSGTISLTRATLASDNTVYAQLILDLGPEKVCRAAKLLGITTKLDCYPGRGPRRPHPRRHDARDGERLRDARQRRHPPQGHRHREGRLPGRQERAARQPEGQARDDRRAGLRGHEDPRDERPVRHRHRGGLRLPGGRQDGHDRRGEGRLVRGLHAAPVDGGLGRLSGRRRRDAGRPGRHLRRAGLARLHAARAAATTATTSRFPTEPFVSSPFFGKYSSTGGSSYDDRLVRQRLLDTDTYTESPDSADGGTDYDPNLYESQPQPEPDVQVPPAQEELAPPAGRRHGRTRRLGRRRWPSSS